MSRQLSFDLVLCCLCQKRRTREFAALGGCVDGFQHAAFEGDVGGYDAGVVADEGNRNEEGTGCEFIGDVGIGQVLLVAAGLGRGFIFRPQAQSFGGIADEIVHIVGRGEAAGDVRELNAEGGVGVFVDECEVMGHCGTLYQK
jgi:hypothetical protein